MSDSDRGPADKATLLELTARIVSAYAGKAALSPAELVAVIGTVSQALSDVGGQPAAPKTEGLTPAVPVKKSVSADFIVCLEDGKKLKMLKRHLMSTYGMTPAEYRAKWGLPGDYPMTAPAYAATRSALAKKTGLGKTPAPAQPVEPARPAAKRGRPRKSAA